MRVKLNITGNTTPVPNNQMYVNSYIHKCLGVNNEYHDKYSDYSCSHLYGGRVNKKDNTLDFPNGGYIVFTTDKPEILSKLMLGALSNKEFGFGMEFGGFDHISESFRDGWNHLSTLSPILLKEQNEETGRGVFKTIQDSDFSELLTNRTKNKLEKIDPTLDLSDFKIVVPNHPAHKVKTVMVKHIFNLTSSCQVSIFTNKKVMDKLYNLGLGQSTGSGFGGIYNTKNHKIYR